MEYFILTIYCILLIYAANILWLCVGFNKIKTFHYHLVVPKTKFSIVIPFRDEAQNLPKLLESFAKLNYPIDLFEVILVDDESFEKFQVSSFKFQVSIIENIRKTNSPKKDAINTAIAVAKNDWIITTDADCVVPKNWLATFDAFIQKNKAKMIASNVIYNSQNDFLENFQQLDLLSLQGTTIGSFGNNQAFMCNGANFCYEKLFFYELKGFEGNDSIASGDDVFLLQKAILKDKNVVQFLKNEQAIVSTSPEVTWKSLFYQRVRWASKSGNYKDFYSKQLGLSVFTLNLLLILTLFFRLWEVFLYVFALKFLVDYILFRITAGYFKKPLRLLLFSSTTYMFFSVIVVLYSSLGKYEWKGRVFSK